MMDKTTTVGTLSKVISLIEESQGIGKDRYIELFRRLMQNIETIGNPSKPSYGYFENEHRKLDFDELIRAVWNYCPSDEVRTILLSKCSVDARMAFLDHPSASLIKKENFLHYIRASRLPEMVSKTLALRLKDHDLDNASRFMRRIDHLLSTYPEMQALPLIKSEMKRIPDELRVLLQRVSNENGLMQFVSHQSEEAVYMLMRSENIISDRSALKNVSQLKSATKGFSAKPIENIMTWRHVEKIVSSDKFYSELGQVEPLYPLLLINSAAHSPSTVQSGLTARSASLLKNRIAQKMVSQAADLPNTIKSHLTDAFVDILTHDEKKFFDTFMVQAGVSSNGMIAALLSKVDLKKVDKAVGESGVAKTRIQKLVDLKSKAGYRFEEFEDFKNLGSIRNEKYAANLESIKRMIDGINQGRIFGGHLFQKADDLDERMIQRNRQTPTVSATKRHLS